MLAVMYIAAASALTACQVDTDALRRSVVSAGDTARLKHVFRKARSGGKVVVGVIGGSITQGASASSEDKRWGNLVAQWWRETFPKAAIEFVNAGIGATGSDIGAHRVNAHLLAKRPDFVVAEYAVNDPATEQAAETLEGIVRQVMKMPNRPAMALLFTMNNAGENAQEFHAKVGRHYGLPMVSFRDAMWPEVQAGRVKWDDIEADLVHPNDRGHAICAKLITDALQRVLAETPADGNLPRIARLPKPLISDVFERTSLLGPENLTPQRCEGFGPGERNWAFGSVWEADRPGSALELPVEGTTVGIVYYRIMGPMGMAEASVDGGPPVKLDGWFDQTWGGYDACQFVARGLKPGKHTLTIRVLDEKAPRSEGHRFRVVRILCAGLDR